MVFLEAPKEVLEAQKVGFLVVLKEVLNECSLKDFLEEAHVECHRVVQCC